MLILPYIRGLSEKIERVVKPLNIKAVFRTQNTIRQKVMKVKGNPRKEEIKGVVYIIPCECGATYIGETGRTLHARLQEHKRAVRNGDTNNGIAAHVLNTHHNIKWEDAQVLMSEAQLTKRKVKESLVIRRTPNNMNIDKGLQLDNIW